MSGILAAGRCPFSLKWSNCYVSFVQSLLVFLGKDTLTISTHSTLAATGNLQETTQADYLSSLAAGSAAAATGATYKTLAGQQVSAETRALLDDEDLDAYFEAFPEQEATRYDAYSSVSVDSSFKVRLLLSPPCSADSRSYRRSVKSPSAVQPRPLSPVRRLLRRRALLRRRRLLPSLLVNATRC